MSFSAKNLFRKKEPKDGITTTNTITTNQGENAKPNESRYRSNKKESTKDERRRRRKDAQGVPTSTGLESETGVDFYDFRVPPIHSDPEHHREKRHMVTDRLNSELTRTTDKPVAEDSICERGKDSQSPSSSRRKHLQPLIPRKKKSKDSQHGKVKHKALGYHHRRRRSRSSDKRRQSTNTNTTITTTTMEGGSDRKKRGEEHRRRKPKLVESDHERNETSGAASSIQEKEWKQQRESERLAKKEAVAAKEKRKVREVEPEPSSLSDTPVSKPIKVRVIKKKQKKKQMDVDPTFEKKDSPQNETKKKNKKSNNHSQDTDAPTIFESVDAPIKPIIDERLVPKLETNKESPRKGSGKAAICVDDTPTAYGGIPKNDRKKKKKGNNSDSAKSTYLPYFAAYK